MTTNVPQDVLEDAVAAGFIVKDNLAIYSPVSAEFSIEAEILRLLELRAQRQQGSEPVAWWGIVDVEDNRLLETFPDESAANKTLEILNKLVGAPLRKVMPVYTTPPQANNATEHPCDLLVAAAYRKTAEICKDLNTPAAALKCAPLILSAIPADAEAALREVCMKVCEAYSGLRACSSEWIDKEHQAIVNSVLGEGGK
jgi:hypothetical protein